jgi:hypothetical protein
MTKTSNAPFVETSYVETGAPVMCYGPGQNVTAHAEGWLEAQQIVTLTLHRPLCATKTANGNFSFAQRLAGDGWDQLMGISANGQSAQVTITTVGTTKHVTGSLTGVTSEPTWIVRAERAGVYKLDYSITD